MCFLATGIVGYLASRADLRVVFLNGCYTRAHIRQLRSAGIGAVIATTRAIKDDVATAFATEFYAELAAKASVRLAFDRARILVGGERPELVKELVDLPRWEAERAEWDDDWPWILSCEPEFEDWTLLGKAQPEPEPKPEPKPKPKPKDDIGADTDVESTEDVVMDVDVHALVDELAAQITEKDDAMLLLDRMKFPRGRVPWSSNAMVFWSRIVRELEAGVIHNGIPSLIDQATAGYPGNKFFAKHCSKRS